MKKIFILFILSILSCNVIIDEYYYNVKLKDHELYTTPELLDEWKGLISDYNDITTFCNIGTWLENNIEYKSEDIDKVSNPETILNRGYGDCDDFAILYMNILYFITGIKANYLLVDSPYKSVVEGGTFNHSMVEVNGLIIEPQRGRIYPSSSIDIKYRYRFDKVFN